MKRLSLLILATTLAGSTVWAQTCPSYTHKSDAAEGVQANLPDGWFVFNSATVTGTQKTMENGLFRSPLKSYSRTLIPNTSTDQPLSIDISDDGNWIVYVASNQSNACYIIKTDGSHKATIPVQVIGGSATTKHGNPMVIGFNHNSPKGTEIYYADYFWSGMTIMRAVTVDVSNGTPVFGTDRVILDCGTTSGKVIYPYGNTQVFCAVKDQIFGLFYETVNGTRSVRNAFVTIPDNGNGQAGPTNFFAWANDSAKLSNDDIWGCGQAMSWDGQYCATNTGWIGKSYDGTPDSSCIPNKRNNPAMDHKGFYLSKFMRQGVDPMTTIHAQVDSAAYGRSINWCPTRFRFGTESTVDFNNWHFSNNSSYIIGSLVGSASPVWGLWIVNWQTNVWTLVTPNLKTAIFNEPAVWIGAPAAINNKLHSAPSLRQHSSALKAALTVPSGSSAYSLTGARFIVKGAQSVKGIAIQQR